MRPGDKFTLVNSEKTSFDDATFAKLYLPILGKTASSLYHLLRTTSNGKLSNLMEYLNIGQLQLEHAFDKLCALSLLRIFDQHSQFQFLLKSPKNFEDFMADDLLVQLLIDKIGTEKVAQYHSPQAEGTELKVRFSEVFMAQFQINFDESAAEKNLAQTTANLDLKSFKSLMSQKKLTFADENKDLLHLYSLAEKFGLDWYSLFKLAEECANADHTINTAAMIRRQISNSESRPKLENQSVELAQVAKSASPQDFLTQLKRQVGGFVSQDELKLLSNFSKQKLPPEVQNILIHYTLVQQKNPSLTAAIVNRIANDWLRNGVTTAEAAIQRSNEFESFEKKPRRQAAKKIVKTEPAWSNPDYQEKASDEEVAAFKKELDAMRKGG